MSALIAVLALAPIVSLVVLIFARGVRIPLAAWVADRPVHAWILASAVLAWQAVLEIATGSFDKRFLWLSIYVAVITLVTAYLKKGERANWNDLVIILALYLPPIVGLVSFDTGMPKLWGIRIPYGLIAAYILILVQARCGNAISFSAPKKTDTVVFLRATLAVFAVALPIGVLMGFLNPGFATFRAISVATIGVIAVNVFLRAALPEEIVFRGYIQGSLATQSGDAPAFLLASAVFGLSHIGHRVVGAYGVFNAPNWSYVFLATICGLGYGFVYMKTRSLSLSIALHLLVDVVWIVFLTNPRALSDSERFHPLIVILFASVIALFYLAITNVRRMPQTQKGKAAA